MRDSSSYGTSGGVLERPIDTSMLSEAERYDLYRLLIERVGIFDTRPGHVNLIGIRGYLNGRPTENRPDRYDDTIATVFIDGGRKRVEEYESTTDPGKPYTEKPLNSAGCAHLMEGRQYLYKPGKHNGRDALVQAGPVTVWRDRDKDHARDAGELVEEGWFGINIHNGGTGEVVGEWSAGCQVIRGGEQGAAWQSFLRRVSQHPAPTLRYALVNRTALVHAPNPRSYYPVG